MSRDDEDELEEETEEEETPRGMGAGGFAAGLAVGALLGAAVALMFAPAPGHVTRRRIRRKLEDAKEYASEELEDLSQRARKEIKKHVG
jgi:gas vesicle protein